MTQYLLQSLFDATWQATALAVVVFLVVFLLRERLQPRWRYLLWCVVLLRLALPVLPETPWGIWSEKRTTTPAIASTEPPKQNIVTATAFDAAEFTPSEEILPIISDTKNILPVEMKVSRVGLHWKTVFLTVWFSGIIFLFVKYCRNEYLFRRQSRYWKTPDDSELLALFESCRRETGVRRSVRLKTATDDVGAGCFGFFRPTIVLSESATKIHAGELRMILLHELVHLKRFDPLVLRLSTLLSLIHWPNPLVWFVLSRLQRERELACDAAVLHILGQQKQKDYGLAILAFAELFPCRERLPGLVGVFEKNGTARRIDMIIKYKRSKWTHALLGIFLTVSLVAVGLTKTSAKAEKPTDDGKTNLPEVSVTTEKPTTPETDSKEQSNQILLKTVDETGKPLGKVEIRVLMGDFKDENRAKTTDDAGNMVLLLPESPKELYVSATAPGRVPQIVYWEKEDMDSNVKIPGEVVFTLRKGISIGGLVVDQEGKPIEGAVLNILSRPNGYGMPGHRKPADGHILAWGDGKPNTFGGITSCKTDRNGRWTLDNVADGKFYPVEIEINRSGYMMNDELGRTSFDMQNDALIEKLRKGEYRFVLKHGISVSGTVRDPVGKPIKDALVVPGGDSFYYHDDRQKAVRTDAEGKYRIDSLRFGSGTITVIAEGFSPDMKQAKFEQKMKPLDFDLKPGKTISFKIVDETGKPVPKAQVNIGSNPDSWWRDGSNLYNKARSGAPLDPKIPVYADDNGLYRWDWAPEDKIRYSFHKEGFLMNFPSEINWFVARPEPYEIVLHHSKTFRGSVVDAETKQPIKKFSVVYGTVTKNQPDTENYVWQTPQEQTFTGVETFQYVPNFQYDKYWLRFTANGYEPFISGPYPLSEKPPVLNAAMKRKAPETMISGQIFLPNGKPAAKAQILVANEREYAIISPPSLFDSTRNRPREPSISDENGKFRFEPPTDKDYRLYVAHPDGFAQLDKAEVKDGMTIRLQAYGRLEIKIPYDTKPDAYNRVSLRMRDETTFRTDENGKMIPMPPKMFGQILYPAIIPPEGNIVIEKVAPGTYLFQKLARDEKSGMVRNVTNFSVEIKPGETKKWDLTFPNGVKLTARIRLPDDYEDEFTPDDWAASRFNLSIANAPDGQPTMNWLEKIRPSKDDPREGVVEIDHVVPGQCNWNVTLNKYEKPEKNQPHFPGRDSFVGGLMKTATIPESGGDAPTVFDLGTIVVPRFKAK